MAIMDIVGGLATGGLTTVLGGVTGIFGAIFKGKAERAQREHQINLMSAQQEALRQQNEFALQEVKLNLQSAEQIAKTKAQVETAAAGEQTAQSAYLHDAQLGAETGFFGALRKSVRPMITYWLAISLTIGLVLLYLRWTPIDDQAHVLFTHLVVTTTYLTTMVFSFWFVDRQKSPPQLPR